MITVRRRDAVVRIEERSGDALHWVAGAFLALGLLCLVGSAASTSGIGGALGFGLLASSALGLARRMRVACELSSDPRSASDGVLTVRSPLVLRWHGEHSSVLGVRTSPSEGDRELFSGADVERVLKVADEVAGALGVPLCVADTAFGEPPRVQPSENRAESWWLPRPGALHRASLAVWVVVLAVAIYFGSLFAWRSTTAPSTLSIWLAWGTSLSVLVVALALHAFRWRVVQGVRPRLEHCCFGHRLRGHEWIPGETTCLLLQHVRLDLGFVLLRSSNPALVVTSNAAGASALVAQLAAADPRPQDLDPR